MQRNDNQKLARSFATIAIACLTACGSESGSGEDPAVARGEKIYRNICVVCHSADPKLDGVQGPAIAHANRVLLEAKVLRGEYPPGHTPKRDTKQMPEFSYLEPNLADIEAFIASRRD